MSSTPQPGKWVAVVDDDVSIGRALGRLLRVHGIDAQTFHSARDYLSRARGTPACLCVDVHLNDVMNGYELTERLRAQGITPPIVFITAQDEPELQAIIKARHHAVVLRKPLDAGVLVDMVIERVRGIGSSGVA